MNSLIGLREIDSYFLSINTDFFRFRLLDTVFAKIQKTASKLKNDINFRTVLFGHRGSFFFDSKAPLLSRVFFFFRRVFKHLRSKCCFSQKSKNNADKKMQNAFKGCRWGLEPQTSLS